MTTFLVAYVSLALLLGAFAYLALRSLKGLPLTLPSTTGVRAPATGGRLFRHPA